MNFFKKIKINYYSKLIPDLIKQNKFSDLKAIFDKIYDLDRRSALVLFRQYYFDLSNTPSKSFFDNSLIWVNSFLKEDTAGILNFLKFYFKNTSSQVISCQDYTNELLRINKSLELKKGGFEYLVNDSYFYQYSIERNQPQGSINFLSNQMAFFESADKKMFSAPNITKCFFYIARDPLEVLTLLDTDGTHENAIMELMNLDQKPITFNQDSYYLDVFRKDWQTNVKSWTSENVIEGFNGLAINATDLDNDPSAVFSDIIAHLIQVGINLNLNYQLIEEYIANQASEKKPLKKIDLSNHKKKLLNGIIKTAQEWGYEIN